MSEEAFPTAKLLMFLKAELNVKTDGYFDKKLLGIQRSS
jgi:hypothetical protein